MTAVAQFWYERSTTVALRYDRDTIALQFTTGSRKKTQLVINHLLEPSGANILGLCDGNTNNENAIDMATVASRT